MLRERDETPDYTRLPDPVRLQDTVTSQDVVTRPDEGDDELRNLAWLIRTTGGL